MGRNVQPYARYLLYHRGKRTQGINTRPCVYEQSDHVDPGATSDPCQARIGPRLASRHDHRQQPRIPHIPGPGLGLVGSVPSIRTFLLNQPITKTPTDII